MFKAYQKFYQDSFTAYFKLAQKTAEDFNQLVKGQADEN